MKKSHSLRMMTFIILAGCYTLIFGGALIYKNFYQILQDWARDQEMVVYLKNDINQEQFNSLEKNILSHPNIKSAKHYSQEMVLKDYQEQLATLLPGLVNDQELRELIPSSFELQVKEAQNFQFESLSNELKNQKGVEDVSYGKEWIDQFQVFIQIIKSSIFMITLVTLGASIFVLSNMMRTLVFRKKDEIEVLEMLGAGSWMIRRPFLVESFLTSVVALVVALTLNGVFFSSFKSYIQAQFPLSDFFQSLIFFSPFDLTMLIFAALFFSLLNAYLSVSSLNDGKSSQRRWVEM